MKINLKQFKLTIMEGYRQEVIKLRSLSGLSYEIQEQIERLLQEKCIIVSCFLTYSSIFLCILWKPIK